MEECAKFDKKIFKKHKDAIFSQLLHTELNLFANKKHQFDKVADLQEPSFWRCFLFTVNPFKKFDVSLIYKEYQSAAPQITPKPKTITAGRMKDIKIPRSIRASLSAKPKLSSRKPKLKQKIKQRGD